MTIRTLPQRYRPTTWPQEEMAMRAISERIICPPYYVNRRHPSNTSLINWIICLPGLDGGKFIYDQVKSNHGTLTSNPIWVGSRGRAGGYGALKLAVVNLSYVNFDGIGNPPLFSSGAAYSISAWVNTVATGTQTFYCESSSTASQPFLILRSTSGSNKLAVLVRNDANTLLLNVASSSDVWDGTWHHFVWTDNVGTCKLYVDGKPDAGSFNYTRSGTFTLNQLCIGAQRTGNTTPSSTFNGYFDDFRTYNKALTANEAYGVYLESTNGYLRQFNIQ